MLAVAAGATRAQGPMKVAGAQLEPVTFAALDGWAEDDHAAAFASFLNSCKAVLNGTKAMRAARPIYGALYEVCEHAAAAPALDREQAGAFFEENFRPVRIAPIGESLGFFTGYYETVVEGARAPNEEYNVPLYRKPANLVMAGVRRLAKFASKGVKAGRLVARRKIVAYHDRAAIEDGALTGRGLEICWVKSPIDAFFAQIQGSTRVKLDTGATLRLNYDAHNGLPYTPVGKFLIDRGIISKEEMSMDRIRKWMEANPDEGKELRRKNRSFVFFRETELADNDECIGAQGVPLTPWRSLAVDRSLHVYGTPFWIEAELPIDSEKPETRFRHLLIAQDTGSAIVGPARADIYFGSGEEIGLVAGRIKQFGRFVMLLPRKLDPVARAKDVPLPPPRPRLADAQTPPPTAAKPDAVAAKPEDAEAAPLPQPRPPAAGKRI